MKKILDIVMSIALLLLVFYVSFFAINTTEAASKDKVIIIDPGHGGNDPGKVSRNNITEKDINLSIALILEELLKENGYEVVITRTEDKGLYSEKDTNKKATDLHNRCNLAKEKNADLLVSIHQNSFSDSNVKGGQVFYYSHSAKGKILAELIQNEFKNIVDNANDRKPKKNDNYYLLVHTECPSVIVECGFLSNPEEEKLLTTESYQNAICQAILEGINKYYEQDI